MATKKKASAKKAAAKKTASKKKAAAKKTGARKADSRADRTRRARERFVEALRGKANVTDACRAAGIVRTTAYKWYREDEEFARQWDAAEEEATDELEREAWRRGIHGIDKPVTHQGQITDTYKEYSDRLLELLLKARRPEKFKDRTEVTGKGGGAIKVVIDSDDADL